MSYPSETYLAELDEALQVYHPNTIPEETHLKLKYESQMRKQYGDVYDVQLDASRLVRDIQMSHLLGCNDVVVPVMASEYGMLRLHLRKLEAALKKMKQFRELKAATESLMAMINVKELELMMINDIKHVVVSFPFEFVDIRANKKVFKSQAL